MSGTRDTARVIAPPPLIAVGVVLLGLALDRLSPVGLANAVFPRSARFAIATALIAFAAWPMTRALLRFRFAGKSGQRHEVGLRDRRLAAIVRRCQDLPGQELFAYVGDDGVPHDISSDDVNEYLREISGIDMTAKDFRTWAGTVLAYRALRALAPVENGTAAKKNVVEAGRLIADRLGNTPAVARNSYVHPAILEAYMEGTIGGALLEAAEEQHDPPPVATPDEASEVVKLIRARLRADDAGSGSQRTR